MISIILPSYNEEENIDRAVERIGHTLQAEEMDYELVFVNDGSQDATWQRIQHQAQVNPHVVGVNFSRNFGKEAAIMAGLAQAKGDCCAVMDCDLQHPPETLIQMLHLWQEGYEVIEGVKRSRGNESVLHRFAAGTFYRLMSNATKIDMSRASDFKLMDRKAVNAILSLPEKNAFFRALSSWVGFKTTSVEFDVQEREAGTSKWSSRTLTSYAVRNITSFSSAPLQLITICGGIVLALALIMGIQTLVRYFSGTAVEGFTTVILLILLIGSVLMLSLGLIGYYLAQIYNELKDRPRYLISEIIRGEAAEPRKGTNHNGSHPA
ncbi:MAG: glycosyltransferase family 2 protein [Clostridia bacterium]|nr:glycosyltransferase family 2 protein [Clostridia bacterium]